MVSMMAKGHIVACDSSDSNFMHLYFSIVMIDRKGVLQQEYG